MKKDTIKAIAIFGLTAAATIIITRLKKKSRASQNQIASKDSTGKRFPHGRHTIVKRRALEALHSIEN